MPFGSVNLLSHLHTQFGKINAGEHDHLEHVRAEESKLGIDQKEAHALEADPDFDDAFENPLYDDPEFHDLMSQAQAENAEPGNFWPEDQLPKVAAELEQQLRDTELPRSISRLGKALVNGSRSLEGWVKQKQMAVDVVKNVRNMAHMCHDKLASTEPLSEECREIRLPMQWYCLRRGATNQMLQFTKDMKRIRELAAQASNEIHTHAGRPRDLAQQAEGDLLQLKYNMNKEAGKKAQKAANAAGDLEEEKGRKLDDEMIAAEVEFANEKNVAPKQNELTKVEESLDSEHPGGAVHGVAHESVNSAAVIASGFAPSWPTALHSEASSRLRRHAQREQSVLSSFL